jgi:hypothetical protein
VSIVERITFYRLCNVYGVAPACWLAQYVGVARAQTELWLLSMPPTPRTVN